MIIFYSSVVLFHEENGEKEEEKESAYQATTNLHHSSTKFQRETNCYIDCLLAWMSAMRIEKRKDVRETIGHALACIGRVFIERESCSGRRTGREREG